MNTLCAGIALSVAILLGRVSGLLREIVLSHQFGAGASADIAVLLLTLPDLLVSLLLSGGLSAALTPVFRCLPEDQSRKLLVQASFLVLLFLSVLGLAMAISPSVWLNILAPGLNTDIINSTTSASRIILFALPLSGLTGVFSAFLNARNKFVLPACGTLVFNTILIIGLSSFDITHIMPISTLALLVAIAATMRWILLAAIIPELRIATAWSQQLINKPLITRFTQALMGSGILILYPVIARAIASLQGSGQIALLNYANKLIELPLGIAITVISAISLPKLSSLFQNPEKLHAAIHSWRHALDITIILSLSIFLSCIWQLDTISMLIFSHGRLDLMQVHALGKVATFGFASILFVGINTTLSAGCYARLDTRIPLLCNLLGLVLLVPCCYALAPLLGTAGVALGVVLAQSIACGTLWFHCNRFTQTSGHSLLNKKLLYVTLLLLPISGIGAYAQTFIVSHLWIILSLIAHGGLLLWIGITVTFGKQGLRNIVNTGNLA